MQELCTKARAALHKPSLHCIGDVFGTWYSSRPPPGSAHSIAAQRSLSLQPEVTHPSRKHPAKGLLQNAKWLQGSPLASTFCSPPSSSFPQGSTAAEFSHYSLSEGTTFWDTTLQFSDTSARINICLTRKGCNTFKLCFQPSPSLQKYNKSSDLYLCRIILPLGQGLLSLQLSLQTTWDTQAGSIYSRFLPKNSTWPSNMVKILQLGQLAAAPKIWLWFGPNSRGGNLSLGMRTPVIKNRVSISIAYQTLQNLNASYIFCKWN